MAKKHKKLKNIPKEGPMVVDTKSITTFNGINILLNIVLLIMGIFIINIYLSSDLGKQWNDKISSYYEDYYFIKEHDLSNEQIKGNRIGASYQVCKSIEEMAKNNPSIKNPVFLFPPNSYVKKVLKLPIVFPEPIVFYNYTGMQSVWLDSPDAYKANIRIDIADGKVTFFKITSRKEIDELKKFYKDFPCTL